MAYTYLFDLHQRVDERVADAKQSILRAAGDSDIIPFHEGRVDILSDFKIFLTLNLDPKLPRALRKRMQEQTHQMKQED